MIRASTAAYARSMAFTRCPYPMEPDLSAQTRPPVPGDPDRLPQAAERIFAPALPRALAAVREQREAADVEARREAGEILEHRVQRVARHVLGDRHVRVVREPGVAI